MDKYYDREKRTRQQAANFTGLGSGDRENFNCAIPFSVLTLVHCTTRTSDGFSIQIFGI